MKLEKLRQSIIDTEPGKAIGPIEIDIDIIRTDPTMQVRDKLDKTNLQRLRSAYRSGSQMPPITIAFIEGEIDLGPVVIDGHHRLHTLEVLRAETKKFGGNDFSQTAAIVSRLSRPEARYAAALANSTHGLQLKPRETRRVFNAYVRAGKHKQGIGFKSYREIGKELQRDHKTIITWMRSDFPSTAAKMGEPERANSDGTGPSRIIKLTRHAGAEALLTLRNAFEESPSYDKIEMHTALAALCADWQEQLNHMQAFSHDDELASSIAHKGIDPAAQF